MDYPVWNVALGGSSLMALVAIAHVIVSHFAIGGGLVIAATETLSVKRGDRELRELARRGSLMLILVSTVFGAISGVGIWVVAGLIAPRGISTLIHNYVWGWAIEWTFFVVEIVAALIYYTTWGRISKAAHLTVGWIYFVAAYLSLVVINGIVTFMLTPGRWLETRAFWDGFFNPTYWPSLVLRTGICAMMATAFLMFVALKAGPTARPRLVRYLGTWLLAGALLAWAGYAWWEASLPETVLSLFLGESPSVEAMAWARSVMMWGLVVAAVLGALLFVAIPRAGNIPTAIIAALAAFAFFGGYEQLREGARKPFLIHSYMFSNGLLVEEIGRVNEGGVTSRSGWVAARAGGGPEEYGRAVYEAQCSSCHTLDKYRAIRSVLPTTADMIALATEHSSPERGEMIFRAECARCHDDYTYEEMKEVIPGVEEIREDPEFVRELNKAMIATTLERLRDLGDHYESASRSGIIDTHETPYPYMPPLVGNDADLEALAAFLSSMERDDAGADRLAAGGGE